MFLKSNDSPSHAAATATSALARGTFYRRISNEKRPRGRARCLSPLCVHHVYRHHCSRRDRCRFPGPRQSLTAVGDDKLTRLCIHLLFLSAVGLSPSRRLRWLEDLAVSLFISAGLILMESSIGNGRISAAGSGPCESLPSLFIT